MAEHLVVTLDINNEQQQVIKENLPEKQLHIDFLASTADDQRASVLKRATILLTLNPVHDLNEHEFELLQNVQFIQLISAGADHFPYQKFGDDILMASNPGAYAKPMAEHVLAMTLCLAKRLREEDQNMREGEFNQFNMNKSMADSTVGILGFGGIGQTTAELFRAFGTSIYAMNTSGESDQPTNFIGTTDDLEHILSSSDIMVLSLPLNNHTRGLIGREQLEWMKDDAILINVARGEIIHQKDLYEHLKSHPEFKAGLESWWVEPIRHGKFELEYPLLELPNVLASPHNSSMVEGASKHGLLQALDNVSKYLSGGPIRGEIDRDNFV